MSASVGIETTTCCIAGCGPAGAMIGLLLARAGVNVLVLEKHADFLRDFRGDTIQASTLQVIAELGLLERFLYIPHQKVYELAFEIDDSSVTLADFRTLGGPFSYIILVPQWDFLTFITDEAARYATFTLRMGSEVIDVVQEEGSVRGVRYRADDGVHEIRALLTIAADGRSSVVRGAAGLIPRYYGSPMDVLWFRISRRDTDPDVTGPHISRGCLIGLINRSNYWQVAYLIPKGFFDALQAQGLDRFRERVQEALPLLTDRVDEIRTWDDVRMLEVQVSRLRRWHRPGLLCIGDAAHAMSPVGGVGVNLAVQDAVAAGNLLAKPLRLGRLDERDLARVQRRRWPATMITQRMQRLMQDHVLASLIANVEPPDRPPAPVRIFRRFPALPQVLARLVAVGILPEHVQASTMQNGPQPQHK